jgi:peptidoglycan/LPS O-acetylase OafA/YrhL/lysophospholipase L1-like esterase
MSVPSDHLASRPGAHVVALDGLRGLAILLVMAVHFVGDDSPRDGIERLVVKLANYGVWGVDLFFILSGFLITGILLDSKRSPHYFRTFYVRRTLRIFPLYYGVLALLFLVLPAVRGHAVSGALEFAREHQAWLWTYTTNFFLARDGAWSLPYVSHFWSLAVEEHFYLVWPLVIFTFPSATLARICVGASAAAVALRCLLSSAGASDVALVALTPCRLDALCMGGLLAIVARERGIEWMGRRAAAALVVCSTLVLALSAGQAAMPSVRGFALPLRGTMVALAFAALLVATIASPQHSWLARFFRSRVMCFLGKYSYGLYVFHGIIAYALVRRGIVDVLTHTLGSHKLAMAAQAIAGCGTSVVIAVASYELYERHFLVLKDRLAPTERSRAPARLSAAAWRRPRWLAPMLLLLLVYTSRDVGAHAPPATSPSTPAALLSRGHAATGRSHATWADPRAAVDGDPWTTWNAGWPTPDTPAWLSIDVGRGPTRVLVEWTAAGSFNYEETDYGSPGGFRVETSADSSNGEDGTWRPRVVVADVRTHAWAGAIPFAGDRWVRFVVTSAPPVSPNGVQIDELEVHDASSTPSDAWFFMGDSITATAFGRPPRGRPGFAERIHTLHPAHYPAVIAGGIGGEKSDDGVRHIDAWLRDNPEARFWVVAYGTNDAAGDADDIATFERNLRTIVDRIRHENRIPILATIPFAADGHHRHIPSFNAVIDDLRRAEPMPAAPDLYAWFASHPDELRDGIHPNDRGIDSILRLWAEALDPLFRK